MKRLSLAEKCLWYLALISAAAMGGCATLSDALKPGPAGEPAPAQTVLQSIGTAIGAFNPLVGAAIFAAGGAIGHTAGKKSAAKKKPATTPAV